MPTVWTAKHRRDCKNPFFHVATKMQIGCKLHQRRRILIITAGKSTGKYLVSSLANIIHPGEKRLLTQVISPLQTEKQTDVMYDLFADTGAGYCLHGNPLRNDDKLSCHPAALLSYLLVFRLVISSFKAQTRITRVLSESL